MATDAELRQGLQRCLLAVTRGQLEKTHLPRGVLQRKDDQVSPGDKKRHKPRDLH